MDTTEVTVFKNTIYRGKILNLRVDIAGLPNGTEAPREFVEHNGGVTVAALTDDAELIFVRQFRYPPAQPVLEIPAGKLEWGEDHYSCAVRAFRFGLRSYACAYNQHCRLQHYACSQILFRQALRRR